MATSDVSDYATALEYLLSRVNYERTSHIPYQSGGLKLDRMRRLLSLFGDPHLGLKAVHIAGTKGKGSTAAMTAAALTAAGYRTGLYTSPHLERIEERMAIDGTICPPERFAALAARLQDAEGRLDAADGGPTFFEITTAMAFLHFAETPVDIAVLEVGLGGRLDSTNVCQPEVSILTSISFDHMRQLGNTLAAIAGEKAGIIKAGVPVISGVVHAEPRKVIEDRAREIGATLFQRGVDFDFDRLPGMAGDSAERVVYREPAQVPTTTLPGLQLGMPGAHQAANAACAVAAILRLRERGWQIPDHAVRQGIATANSPGRIEIFPGRPTVVLDVAHNPASIAAFLDCLEERLPDHRKILIFASSKDKDYAAMLRLLLPRFAAIVLTQYVHNPRAMEVTQLRDVAEELQRSVDNVGTACPAIYVAADPPAAWALSQQLAGQDDAICITGSFFLAAELRAVVSPCRVETSSTTSPLR